MKYWSKAAQNADAMIRRANTQLRAAAAAFGHQSKEYEKMSAKVLSAFGGEWGRYLQNDKNGVLQIRRTKANIAAVASRPDGKHRSMAGKAVESITKQESVQAQKKRILADYERRTGRKPKGTAAREQAIKEQRQHVSTLSNSFQQNLAALYELEQQLGVPLQAIARIRLMSAGAGTSPETLEEMNQIAIDELNAEEHEVDDGFFDALFGD